MEPQNALTETEVRALRDRVFEQVTGDNNWNACRENWLRPDSIAWLKAKAVQITQHATRITL